MPTLTEFLLARIAEDEAIAENALHPDAVQPGSWITEHHNSEYHSEPNRAHIAEDHSGHYWSVAHEIFIPIAEHIARHDPARTLNECKAKKHIIDLLTNASATNWDQLASANQNVLRQLAMSYTDDPDYEEAWRP